MNLFLLFSFFRNESAAIRKEKRAIPSFRHSQPEARCGLPAMAILPQNRNHCRPAGPPPRSVGRGRARRVANRPRLTPTREAAGAAARKARGVAAGPAGAPRTRESGRPRRASRCPRTPAGAAAGRSAGAAAAGRSGETKRAASRALRDRLQPPSVRRGGRPGGGASPGGPEGEAAAQRPQKKPLRR